MAEITFGTAPARTVKRTATGPRARSTEQQSMDELVEKLVSAWEQAGKPSQTSEKPAAYIPVKDEDEYEDTLKKLRSAGTFLNVSVRFYDPAQNEDGTVSIVVSAEEKRAYTPRPGARKNTETSED